MARVRFRPRAALAALLALALLQGPVAAESAAQPWPERRGEFAGLEEWRCPLPVPPHYFMTLDGQRLDLSRFRGKPVVLNLWATWCPPCVEEMPSLDRLARLRQDRIHVLSLTREDEAGHVVPPFFADHGLRQLAAFIDPGAIGTSLIGTGRIPETLILDAEGRLAARLEGPTDWSSPQVLETLDFIAAGKHVAPQAPARPGEIISDGVCS